MTQVALVCLEQRDAQIEIRATANFVAADLLAQMPQRVALGSVYPISAIHSVASLGVRDHFVMVPKGIRATYQGSPAENFWEFTKQRMTAFRKVPCKYFPLYLAECWFRFHYRANDLVNALERSLHAATIAEVREILQPIRSRDTCPVTSLIECSGRGQVLSASQS
jgi:hypothetical protein